MLDIFSRRLPCSGSLFLSFVDLGLRQSGFGLVALGVTCGLILFYGESSCMSPANVHPTLLAKNLGQILKFIW